MNSQAKNLSWNSWLTCCQSYRVTLTLATLGHIAYTCN